MLLRGKESSTAEALTLWQDRLATVVEESRARLSEIGGES